MTSSVSGLLWTEVTPHPGVAGNGGYDELALRGTLSLATVPRVRTVVGKLLADRGAVVVDLAQLRVLWTPAVEVFPAALTSAGGWPAARMVLTGASDDTLGHLQAVRVPRTVPVTTDPAAAAQRLACRPDRVSRRLDLPPHPGSPRAARVLVREACADWNVTDTGIAVLLVTELVTNAVRHAGTSCRVTVALDDDGLRVAVRDYAPGPAPHPRPVEARTGGGRGLHLVALLARSWGSIAHADGKTVWAMVEPA